MCPPGTCAHQHLPPTMIHVPSGTAGIPCPDSLASDCRASAGLLPARPHGLHCLCPSLICRVARASLGDGCGHRHWDVHVCVLRAPHSVGWSWRRAVGLGLQVNMDRSSTRHCPVQSAVDSAACTSAAPVPTRGAPLPCVLAVPEVRHLRPVPGFCLGTRDSQCGAIPQELEGVNRSMWL